MQEAENKFNLTTQAINESFKVLKNASNNVILGYYGRPEEDFKGAVHKEVYSLLKSGGFIDIDFYMLHKDELAKNYELTGMIEKIDKRMGALEIAIDKAYKGLEDIAKNPRKYTEEHEVVVTKKKAVTHTRQISELIYPILATVVSIAVAITAIVMKNEILGAIGVAGTAIFPCVALYLRKYQTIEEENVTEIKSVYKGEEPRDAIAIELRDTLKENVAWLKQSLNEFVKEGGKEVVPLNEDLVYRCSVILDGLEKKGPVAGHVYKAMKSLGVDLAAYEGNELNELSRVIGGEKYQKPGADRVELFLNDVTKRLKEVIGEANMYGSSNPSLIYANKNAAQVNTEFVKHIESKGKQQGEGQER